MLYEKLPELLRRYLQSNDGVRADDAWLLHLIQASGDIVPPDTALGSLANFQKWLNGLDGRKQRWRELKVGSNGVVFPGNYSKPAESAAPREVRKMTEKNIDGAKAETSPEITYKTTSEGYLLFPQSHPLFARYNAMYQPTAPVTVVLDRTNKTVHIFMEDLLDMISLDLSYQAKRDVLVRHTTEEEVIVTLPVPRKVAIAGDAAITRYMEQVYAASPAGMVTQPGWGHMRRTIPVEGETINTEPAPAARVAKLRTTVSETGEDATPELLREIPSMKFEGDN